MHAKLNILMAQINPTVGAIEANRNKIIKIIKDNQLNHDVIVFPELALTGYPPEDLLFRKEFHRTVIENLAKIQAETHDCYVLIGHPTLDAINVITQLVFYTRDKQLKYITNKNYPIMKYLMKHDILLQVPKIPVY